MKKERDSWYEKILSDEKENLLKQKMDLKESLDKLVEGKTKLEIIIGNQRNLEKQGIGYDL